MSQHVPSALKPSAISLGPGGSGVVFISAGIIKKLFWKEPGAVDASNKKAFDVHLGSDPNGILDGVQHDILTHCSWYRFFGLDKAGFSGFTPMIYS